MSIPRYLLASDLDGTLIPPEITAQRLREVKEFTQSVTQTPGLFLAYVTGRHLAMAETGLFEFGLPKPDLMVCDVGTSLYRRVDTGFKLDQGYRCAMQAALGGLRGEDVRGLLNVIAGLELQEAEKQAEFKVSYYVSKPLGAVVDLASDRLKQAGVTANIVASYDPVSGRGLLDVLPAAVAKDYAVRYLHDQIGVEEEHLVYAGDSGNDRAAMLAGYNVVVVSNAEESLKEELRREAASREILERIYFAQHPYARGVLEGCRHFGILSS